jgi:hypothetical protein
MTAAHESEPAAEPKPKKKNLAAVPPAEAEAKAETDGYFTIEHCGITLRVPSYGEITIPAMDLFRKGDNYGGTQEMLGEEQWKLLHDARLTMNQLDDLGGKMKEVTGN